VASAGGTARAPGYEIIVDELAVRRLAAALRSPSERYIGATATCDNRCLVTINPYTWPFTEKKLMCGRDERPAAAIGEYQ
jgi:hypothetical protein